MNKKTKKYIIIALVVAIAISGLYFAFRNGKGSTVKLETVSLKRGNISTSVTATGTVEPISLVEVGTQVSGVISNIYVDFNSVVKKGQILAELDKNILKSELESTQATLMSRQTEFENEQKNYDRKKILWEKQAISKADWEATETMYKTTKLAVTSSRAAVLKAQTNLGYATITASIDGVVISRDVEQGQTVAASFSTPTLFTIANDLTKMRVIANVDEADIGGVIEGQRVEFLVDAYPDDKFEGRVVQVRLQATITSNVVTYEVVIDAPNPDLKLKPGLTANVVIYTMEKNDVQYLPLKAFRFSPDKAVLEPIEGLLIEESVASNQGDANRKSIWVKTNNVLAPRLLTIGASDGVNIEIVEGVSTNEEVVTGVLVVKNGEANGSNGEKSPFMPTPPDRRKK